MRSYRIPKQGNLWRNKGEHNEQRSDQADNGEGESGVSAFYPVIFECPPLKEKDQPGGDIKNGDVDPVRGLSKGTVIGVKQHRDQRQAQQNLRQLDTPVVFLFPEKGPLHQRKEKQGPEQQLHMLPGGFVHPGKGGDQDAAACPVVQKMQDCAAEGGCSEPGPLPKRRFPLHSITPMC